MCDKLPDVPVNVSVGVPAAALLAAIRVKLCAVPGVNDNVAGLLVTPAGSPVIATATGEANPFAAVAVTLTGCPAPPAVTATVVGATLSEKSGAGGGVGVGFVGGGVVELE